MKNIAIIPARSGSKGLPHKNIKFLVDKPLIAYTIEAALQSELFDEVMVSTDSEAYAEIAREYGASVPFIRSTELSSDQASSWDVVKEVINWYQNIGEYYESLCLLQPTSPLRNEKHIKEAYHLYKEKKASTVISVCEVDHSPLWTNILPENLSLTNFVSPDIYGKSRQSLEKYYRLNGAIYIMNTNYLTANGDLYGQASFAYPMTKEASIDIDDMFDFEIAKLYLNKKI